VKLRFWYKVHGKIDVCPSPAAWLDNLRPPVAGLTHDFQIRDGKWQKGVFGFETPSNPVVAEAWREAFGRETLADPIIYVGRLLPGDEFFDWDGDGWEAELRKWSETNCDHIIDHVRNTRQTIFLDPIEVTLGEYKLARICEQLCGFLARETDGLIHVYQEGFFNAEGESIFPRCPKHRLKTS